MNEAAKFEQREWASFLREWNEGFLRDTANVDVESFCEAYDNLRAPIIKKWLGEPGATSAEIARAEERLRVSLPEDYRAFLTLSNGWTAPSFNKGRMLSPVHEVSRFETRYPDTFQVIFDGGVFPFFGEDLEPLEPGHIQDMLAVSDHDNGAILLFDPSAGTRAFWHLDFHGPSSPFRTFTEMVLFAKEWSDRSFVEVLDLQALNETRDKRAV